MTSCRWAALAATLLALMAESQNAQIVVEQGREFRTADLADPYREGEQCQQNPETIPDGWVWASQDDHLGRQVIAKYPWGTVCVELKGGSSLITAYGNEIGYTPGISCEEFTGIHSPSCSETEDDEGRGVISCASCPVRALLTRELPGPIDVTSDCIATYNVTLKKPDQAVRIGVLPGNARVGAHCFFVTSTAHPDPSLNLHFEEFSLVAMGVDAIGSIRASSSFSPTAPGTYLMLAENYTSPATRELFIRFNVYQVPAEAYFTAIITAGVCPSVVIAPGSEARFGIPAAEYTTNLIRCFIISPPRDPSKFVTVNFLQISTEPLFDYISVFSGNSLEEENAIISPNERLSGYHSSLSVSAPRGEGMVIRFISDGLNAGPAFGYEGFTARVSLSATPAPVAPRPTLSPTPAPTPPTVAPERCTTRIDINLPRLLASRTFAVVPQRGTEDEPFCPEGSVCYENNMRACWYVNVSSPSHRIQMRLSSFESEAGYDFLYVYDGADSTSSRLLAEVTGERIQTIPRSTGPDLFVVFETDESVSMRGFTATVTAVSSS